MSSDIYVRGIISAFLGIGFALTIFGCTRRESSPDSESDTQRYTAYISPLLLPLFVAFLACVSLPTCGIKATAQMLLSLCFDIFLHISLYYFILLCLLPILRKYISARACAMLWLIPNYLYITQATYTKLPEPAMVLHAPASLVHILFALWFAGFLGFLLWKMASHLLFRHRILSSSRPVIGTDAWALWESELASARYKNKHIQLVRSPSVKTPLSIGFFKRTICVVLPDQDHTPEELSLIFRHELVHIGRQDSSTKFFMTFCTAMCWFNPLMWIAMKKSAEDLELSCDETVLLTQPDSTRSQYAGLILSSAGDERGFTTCLSASAKSLRYRLKNIVAPRKRLTGGIVVGLCFFILCMTSGYVALAYETASGSEVIFEEAPDAYSLQYINWGENGHYEQKNCIDMDPLYEYLSDLTLSKMTGNYSLNTSSPHFWAIFDSPRGEIAVYIHGKMLTLTYLSEDNAPQTDYYIETELDWDYLESLLT